MMSHPLTRSDAKPDTRFVTCPECDGLGEWDEGQYRLPCPICGGTGRAEVQVWPIDEEDIAYYTEETL